MYKLTFISEDNFRKHIASTLQSYYKSLKSINLNMFNQNIIDPIKLLFDKSVFQKNFDEVINLEIYRQRDKSNNNAIGYFHQNIFKYIQNCVVPPEGWDVIVNLPTHDIKIYVEMKNKYNTMNSASSQKIYINMQDQIAKNPNDYCYLVEVIAPTSRSIPWKLSKYNANEHIRRVSIDKFYALVTGIEDAFYQMCLQLPETINELIKEYQISIVQEDTVLLELHKKNYDTLKSVYLLAFESYDGFNRLK